MTDHARLRAMIHRVCWWRHDWIPDTQHISGTTGSVWTTQTCRRCGRVGGYVKVTLG